MQCMQCSRCESRRVKLPLYKSIQRLHLDCFVQAWRPQECLEEADQDDRGSVGVELH